MSRSRSRRLVLSAPVVPETELHAQAAAALDKLLLPPAQWTTFPAGHIGLSGQAAAKLARLGLKPGWPDILVLHRRCHGIELKTRRGTLSHSRIVRTRRGGMRLIIGQAEMHPLLEAAGMPIVVCHSLDEILAALRLWEVPVRRTS